MINKTNKQTNNIRLTRNLYPQIAQTQITTFKKTKKQGQPDCHSFCAVSEDWMAIRLDFGDTYTVNRAGLCWCLS